MKLASYILPYLIILNLFTMAIMLFDKYSAMNHLRRIPERRLMLFSILGGSAGMLVSMFLFHHKTRKLKFRLGVPLILLAQLGLYGYFIGGWFEALMPYFK